MRKLPCLPGWLAVLALGLLSLIPVYPYVRLIPLGLAAVTAVYCLLICLKSRFPEAVKGITVGFTAFLSLGVLVLGATGVMIFRAGLSKPEPCQYVIVLGAMVYPDGPSVSLQERIDAAYEYLCDNPDAIAVVSGGKGDDEHISEGQCMYQHLVAMGIDPERIWVEDQARSTWGNLNYSLELIEEKTGTRPNEVGVLTHEFHLFRAGLQARDMGLTVKGIPAKSEDFQRWLHYFIREIAGVWHYILIGGTYQ